MRDILAQRWRRTERTYDRENPKRVYYLSLEFLIGRSLANNIMNLRLDPVARSIVEQGKLDWPAMLEEEPDAGLGNGGLGRLAACFLDSMATMQLPAMGYGLRYEYGIFRQTIENGWQHEQPDNWLRHPDPWEVARPQETVEIKLGCSFVVDREPARGLRQAVARCWASRTIGRSWATAARPSIRFGCGPRPRRMCSTSRRSAPARSWAPWPSGSRPIGDPGPLSRRFDDHGARPALRAGVFPGRLLAGRSGAAIPARTMPTGTRFPTRSRSSSTTPIPAWRCRS